MVLEMGLDQMLGFSEIVIITFRLKYFLVLGKFNRIRSELQKRSMNVL